MGGTFAPFSRTDALPVTVRIEPAQENDLRLDMRPSALESAIVPGNSKESGILERISSKDPDLVMPPPDSGRKPLSDTEIDAFRRWIDSGAEYTDHWAYSAPTRPPLPSVKNADWPLNEIDHFTLAGMEQRDLTPAGDADRRTLARRLSFDLIGLPPSPETVRRLEADQSPEAYEKLVDELLAS